MKKIITSCFVLAGLTFAGPAMAADPVTGEVTSIPASMVSNSDLALLNTCLNAEDGTSKEIRACSKSLRAIVPSHEIKSDIYTRRGLLQLSNGRYERASSDFTKAARLNGENEFAWLGQGYTAMMQRDYDQAMALFNDCDKHPTTAPLASYGKAMTLEMMGDKDAAIAEYKSAAESRPNWSAPRAELQRLGVTDI